MGILKDLEIGESAEKKIINLYKRFGYPSAKNEDTKTRSYYDITSALPFIRVLHSQGLTMEKFTTEVKHDLYANKSGNIAIETFNPKTGKDSGLSITKADLWIHITDIPYITSVKILKEYVEENKPFRIISCGGDDNATLYLYKADIILDAIFEPFPLDISKRDGQKVITTLLGV